MPASRIASAFSGCAPWALFLAAGLAGCSSAAPWVYGATHPLRINQCHDLPPPEREECMHLAHESLDEQEKRGRERE